ncbi:uncharacterized protein LOC124540270 [Vanessa cardui]|uniref:uncharacterized protein LOC124540270 n=1 Tax=Vanessa cardui TaxID=171605 RepID=UPI001F12A085|nr:uncharacterized protein LOC124540270 [Vanessa cardui]
MEVKIALLIFALVSLQIVDAVGDDISNPKCIPFVSQYSDCSEANECSGCNRCACSAEGEWECEAVFDCSVDENDSLADRQTITTAIDAMSIAGLKKKAKKKPQGLVPGPLNSDDEIIGYIIAIP